MVPEPLEDITALFLGKIKMVVEGTNPASLKVVDLDSLSSSLDGKVVERLTLDPYGVVISLATYLYKSSMVSSGENLWFCETPFGSRNWILATVLKKGYIHFFAKKMFSYFSIRSVFFHSVEKREILCHSKISSNQLFREIVAKKVWERIFSVPLEMVQNKILVNFTISKLACTIRETQCVTVCKMKNIPWKQFTIWIFSEKVSFTFFEKK